MNGRGDEINLENDAHLNRKRKEKLESPSFGVGSCGMFIVPKGVSVDEG